MPPHPEPTAADRGLTAAMRIQRTDPKTWRAQVDQIEDAEQRQVADAYLRTIIARLKVVAALRRGGGR